MAVYKVGSIGNLISAKTNNVVGPTIVYKNVTPKPCQDQTEIRSSGEQPSPKKRVTFDSSVITSENKKRKKEELDYIPLQTRDQDEVQFKADDTFYRNAKRRINIKANTHKHVDDPEREARTVFVGNFPYAGATKKKLVKFFSTYGEVESVRFRCAPLKDPRMSKKVAVIRHDFHPERSSITGFVVFQSLPDAQSALKANGIVYRDHHLRIDLASNASKMQCDPKKSVFIGNLPFSAEEEDLWKFFSECGVIESVRIVRDAITAVSKGVAFVNFQSTDAAELALQLDGTTLKKRNLSVKRFKPSAKPLLNKSPSEKVVRHKTLDVASRSKTSKQEEIRMYKKAKRRMRKEGENLLGLAKKTKNKGTAENVVQEETKVENNGHKHTRFEEEVEDTKRIKKSKVDLENSGLQHVRVDEEESKENEVKGGKNKSKHLRFQGQTIEESKKKKKKKNKGDLKKKKTAALLSGVCHQKKKGQKVKLSKLDI